VRPFTYLAFGPLVLGACANTPDRVELCTAFHELPEIRQDAASGDEYIDVSVMIYNVEGLPWPARRSRTGKLEYIAEELRRQRAAGHAPDVVLLQEAFTPVAAKIGPAAGYRTVIAGPTARDRRTSPGAPLPADWLKQRRLLKGERTGKLLGSGLHVLSDYPVMSVYREPFSPNACAGYDCLANKGVMLARVWIPGVPSPVDIVTTHMNSQRASGVPAGRADAAHRAQVDESAGFLERTRTPENPLIMGGDFNMRRSPDRLDHFGYRKPYRIVRHYCSQPGSGCDVRMSWDGDAPWLDTQDLQIFDDGSDVRVRPVRVEATFDGADRGDRVSDHDGYQVTYRLSWKQGANLVEEQELSEARRERRSACLPTVRGHAGA
jgi:hypothetical protein